MPSAAADVWIISLSNMHVSLDTTKPEVVL